MNQDFNQRLSYFNNFTQKLIDTIPPKFYFHGSDMKDTVEAKKRLAFEDSKVSIKIKNKKFKLNENLNKPVSKIINSSSSQSLKPTSSTPKIYNSNGDLVFSKFDLISSSLNEESKSRLKKNKKAMLKGSLKKIERNKGKIEKLANEGKEDKAYDKHIQIKWKTALDRSEGIKVKDDPKLIKKTLHRAKKEKERKYKKWKDRINNVEMLKEKRQQKREKNLQKRKDERKAKKMKRLKKKGRLID